MNGDLSAASDVACAPANGVIPEFTMHTELQSNSTVVNV